jgi:hypothetical protein
VGERLAGLALFLPVPLVLFLFTRAPLGVAWSVGLGILVMVTHRLYARPFALAHAAGRCLWCGGALTDGPSLAISDPLGTQVWRACSDRHATRAAKVLGWAMRHALFLRVGILGTLALFLPAVLLSAAHRLGAVTPEDAVAFFRIGIALCVLPIGLRALVGPPPATPDLAAPFPLHIQALIGTHAVLWLFRLMGLAWLGLGLAHIFTRGAW